jgi:hypothetical protein
VSGPVLHQLVAGNFDILAALGYLPGKRGPAAIKAIEIKSAAFYDLPSQKNCQAAVNLIPEDPAACRTKWYERLTGYQQQTGARPPCQTAPRD